jgi:hypothetical protein
MNHHTKVRESVTEGVRSCSHSCVDLFEGFTISKLSCDAYEFISFIPMQ